MIVMFEIYIIFSTQIENDLKDLQTPCFLRICIVRRSFEDNFILHIEHSISSLDSGVSWFLRCDRNESMVLRSFAHIPHLKWYMKVLSSPWMLRCWQISRPTKKRTKNVHLTFFTWICLEFCAKSSVRAIFEWFWFSVNNIEWIRPWYCVHSNSGTAHLAVI